MKLWKSAHRETCEEGFTLIEILMAMVIGMLVIAAIYAATSEGHRASTGIEQKISAQQDVRMALHVMTTEISMVSYNAASLNSKTPDLIWRNPDDCNSVGVSTFKGIQIAAADRLSLQMDLNDNGIINKNETNNDSNEIVTYEYADKRIIRNVNCGGGQPFLGDTTADAVSNNVNVINDEVGILMFRYFDGKGDELPAPVDKRQDIRKIRITIAVEAAAPDVQGQKRRMVYSSEVITRNHVPAF
jgi:type IV pilus assembly protein PilW